MKYTAKYFKDNMPEWKRKKDAFVVQKFYRPLSFYGSSFAANHGISANTVSYFSVIVAIIGCILFLFDSKGLCICGAVLFSVWSWLDCVDGNLARSVRKQPFGEFADSMSSYILVGLMGSAMGISRIVITPWKCSECEVCVASCSNHGIDGMKLRQLTTLGPVSIYKCRKTLCKECGKPIAPDSAEGVCTVCRIKARTKKRQEEAAARAKQLREEREAKKAAEEAAKAAEEAGAAVSAETAAVPAEAAVPAAAGSVISAVTPAKPAPTLPDETPEAAAPKND